MNFEFEYTLGFGLVLLILYKIIMRTGSINRAENFVKKKETYVRKEYERLGKQLEIIKEKEVSLYLIYIQLEERLEREQRQYHPACEDLLKACYITNYAELLNEYHNLKISRNFMRFCALFAIILMLIIYLVGNELTDSHKELNTLINSFLISSYLFAIGVYVSSFGNTNMDDRLFGLRLINDRIADLKSALGNFNNSIDVNENTLLNELEEQSLDSKTKSIYKKTISNTFREYKATINKLISKEL